MKSKVLGKEARNVDDFCSNRTYFIPPYQRGYKWKEKNNWNNFWKSITYVFDNPSEIHFIGNFITKRRKNNIFSEGDEYDIVDGHQRLATFFIFSAAFIEVIKICEEKENRKQEKDKYAMLRGEFRRLIFVDPIGINEKIAKDETKLQLRNNKETKKFKSVINAEKGVKTSFLPKKAFDFFFKKLKNRISEYEIASKIFGILKKKMMFTVIELDEESTTGEVLNIFNTLNDTGERFSSADVLKCFLFVKCEEEMGSTKLIEESWEEMEEIFESNQNKINNFLYNFLASRYKRDRELKAKEFDKFAEKVITKELEKLKFSKKKEEEQKISISIFLETFNKYSKIHRIITEPVKFTFGDNKKENKLEREFRLLLIDIKRLGYAQLNQVSLALYFEDKLKMNKKNQILELLVKYTFRKVTFKDLKASKVLEKPSQDWTKLLQEGKGEEILKEKTLTDEFSEESNKEIYNKLKTQTFPEKVYKHLLRKYYSSMWPQFLSYNGKEELEHLVPKNENNGEATLPYKWKKIKQWNELSNDKKKLSKLIYSIGNTTIINDIENRVAQDDLWSKKIEKENYVKNIGLWFEEKEVLDRQSKLEEETIQLTKKIKEEKDPARKKELSELLFAKNQEKEESKKDSESLLIDRKKKNKEELFPEDITGRTERLVKSIKNKKLLEFDL